MRLKIKILCLGFCLAFLSACAGLADSENSAATGTSPVVEDAGRAADEEKAAVSQSSEADNVEEKAQKKAVDDLSSLHNIGILEASPVPTSTAQSAQSEAATVSPSQQSAQQAAKSSAEKNEVKVQTRPSASRSSAIDSRVRGKAPPVRKQQGGDAVNTGNAASRTLLASSEEMLNKGEYRLAANSAERALRVSPRNPQAYYQLSLIYQKQKNHNQAIHFAEKALAQKGVSASLRRKLWLIKANCYSALGDTESASYAKKQAG